MGTCSILAHLKNRKSLSVVSLARACILLWFVVICEFDLLWEVTHFYFTLLSQSIACNSLECQFYIDCLLCTGFKIRNLIFTMTPQLCSFCRYSSIFKINLISKYNKGKVIWVSR